MLLFSLGEEPPPEGTWDFSFVGLSGKLIAIFWKTGLKTFEARCFPFLQTGAFAGVTSLAALCRMVGLDVLCIIGYALHWAPHLLKSTEKQQDTSDSFILGRTPRMDSMTLGMYFSSGSPSVLRNKDDQGEKLHSLCTTFNKCHRFYLKSSMLQNDLTLQWK